MPETTSTLTAARGNIIGRVIRIRKFVLNFDQQPIQNPFLLQERLIKLDECWHDFDKIQLKLDLTEAIDNEEQERKKEEFEETFYGVKFILTTKLQELGALPPANSRHTNQAQIAQALPGQNAIKLPALTIPKFSGDFLEWLTFKDTFVALIHNNAVLSSVQKMFYLKSSMQGDAARLIDSLETSNENYNIAWAIISNRFENKRLIIGKYVDNLFKLPTMHSESAVQLRKLLSDVTRNINVLHQLGEPTESWSTLIVHLVSNRLDTVTRRDFEETIPSKQMPTMPEIMEFLETRCQVLETVSGFKPNNISQPQRILKNKPIGVFAATSTPACPMCKEQHPIYRCQQFLDRSQQERAKLVSVHRLCFNCLSSNHQVRECVSSLCRKCNRRHHTLLHIESESSLANLGANSGQYELQGSDDASNVNHVAKQALKNSVQVLLSTAIINIQSRNGTVIPCRALLDSASQSNFISESLCQVLNLKKENVNIPINGINQTSSRITQKANTCIMSKTNDFCIGLDFLLLPRITGRLPSQRFNAELLNIPLSFKLADPDFNQPNKVDVLLGAEVYGHLLLNGRMSSIITQPILQNSVFGWIVSGKFDSNSITVTPPVYSLVCETSACENVDQCIERFWTIDEISTTPTSRCPPAGECEVHFLNHYQRTPNGRFIVSLPLKEDPSRALGQSDAQAMTRFLSLEKRLAKNIPLQQMYSDFMNEYEGKGHMKEISADEQLNDNPIYYLPHHAVLKLSSTTTKLRTVFDASCKTTSGKSLNDIMMVGPTIQDDLFTIILRFRLYKYVLTADIKQMYRQIEVDKESSDLQRIYWRQNSSLPLKKYRLRTVTYGTAAAPFLAMRCVQRLAEEDGHLFPKAQTALMEDFYVDDFLSGSNDKNELLERQKQVISLLKSGGFELHKWNSNNAEFLKEFVPELIENETSQSMDDHNDTVKTLGLYWDSKDDQFSYKVKLDQECLTWSKRSILSFIASIFDPLGLVGPVIVLAKIVMQQLWQLKTDWDEKVPHAIVENWTQLYGQLSNLNDFRITRWTLFCQNPTRVQLHGFSDASEMAYGACLYIRSSDELGNLTVNLLCAKSRIAPLKKISLPRLELCGAKVLAQMVDKILSSIKIKFDDCFLWSDSTIALQWISEDSSRWKTYVANRVTEIQAFTKTCSWRHVSGKENPADVLSRGEYPDQLLKNNLWWHGPTLLKCEDSSWPRTSNTSISEDDETLERRVIVLATTLPETTIFSTCSSLTRLTRIIAYCFRFCFNSKIQTSRVNGPLTVLELSRSLTACIYGVQQETFKDEFKEIDRTGKTKKKSKLISLNPFVDTNSILRVGGRLKNASLSFDQKHPIILPPHHNFSKLIVRDQHYKNLHAGPQATLNAIRVKYWPIGAKSLVRQIVRKCVICFRARPRGIDQIMGNLPSVRVEPARPFVNCGVDYLGPISIRSSILRKSAQVKSYVAVFVCMSTKAVHLELVAALTTEAFIGAFKRFTSRRGKCLHVYSDNATTFVGAESEMKDFSALVQSQLHQNAIIDSTASDSVTWHFIPPRAPNFGGLWEAGVKGVKNHLKRITAGTLLTYEELNTLLVQIEGCLNSRPLTPLSNNPEDLLPLTPGHFLIGDRMTTPLEPDLTALKMNRLSRWQRVTQLNQLFWKRYSDEYLQTLQQRHKWNEQNSNLEKNTMVLIKEDNLPPQRWAIGRVIELHPGNDGVVRVATLLTASGTFKRAISKLCPLPIEDKEY